MSGIYDVSQVNMNYEKHLKILPASSPPIDRPNVDTDAIIPKQYLKSIKRSGFGPNLFDEDRYLDPGLPDSDQSHRRLNPDFILNQPRYQGTQILLTRDNFGCGSSREHAVWALEDYGIRTIIGTTFADIFFSNAFKNGLLLIKLDDSQVNVLFDAVNETEGYQLSINLKEQTITQPGGDVIEFDVNQESKHRLLEGLDDIGITLQYADDIRAYQDKQKQITPWVFPDLI